MRAPAISPVGHLGRLTCILAAALLAAAMMAIPAKADEPSGADGADEAAVAAESTDDISGAESSVTSAAATAAGPESADALTLAGYLSSGLLRVSADVALVDGDDPAIEPVVGSFTVDGLTYAIVAEGKVALVAVSPRTLADGLAGSSDVSPDGSVAVGSSGADGEGRGIGSGVPTSPQPQPSPSAEAAGSGEFGDGSMASELVGAGDEGAGLGADGAEGLAAPGPDADSDDEGPGEPATLTLPDAVSYDGINYSLATIGPRALAGCDAAVVVIPASVASVDQAALEGSPIASVEVADGNPDLSSFDGMLFDAGLTRLLLIPEGKQGAARIPKEAEVVGPSCFSHSAGVSSIDVEAGSAAYSSRNGCLYDASGEILLRVPAGAIDVQIADGCTTVAAGSLEGCASLATIHAPASVMEVSDAGLGLPLLSVVVDEGADASPWQGAGFRVDGATIPMLSQEVDLTSAAMGRLNGTGTFSMHPNGGYLTQTIQPGTDGTTTNTIINDLAEGQPSGTVNNHSWSLSGFRITTYGLDTSFPALGTRRVSWWGSVDTRCGQSVGNTGWSTSSTGTIVSSANTLIGSYYCIYPSTKCELRAKSSPVATSVSLITKTARLGQNITLPSYYGTTAGYHPDKWEGTCTHGTTVRITYNAASTTVKHNLCSKDLTLTLEPAPNEYTVRYHANTGATLATRTLTYDAAAASTDNPTRHRLLNLTDVYDINFAQHVPAGYTATGWSTLSGASDALYKFGMVTPNLTTKHLGTVDLYLAIQENKASFDPNGGTLTQTWTDTAGNKHTVAFSDEEAASTMIIKWHLSASGGQNTCVYKNAVQFHVNGNLNQVDVSRTGYKMTGWTAKDRYGEVIDQPWYDGTTIKPISRGATYTAQWEPIECAVALDPRGGSGGTASVRATYDQLLPAASMPVRPGYKFEGFFDTPNGGTQYYRADGTSNRSWDKDVAECTLYAWWTPGDFPVQGATTTVHPNGEGEAFLARYNEKGVQTGTVEGPATTNTWSGATWKDGKLGWWDLYYRAYFHSPYKAVGRPSPAGDIRAVGWSRYADGSYPLPEGYTLTATEGDVYAVWPSYELYLRPNGGTGCPTVRGTVAKQLPSIPEADLPTRAGYAFAGYSVQGLTGDFLNIPGVVDGKLPVYRADGTSSYVYDMDWVGVLDAQWDAHVFKMAFDPAGGAWDDAGAGEAVSVEFDQDVTLSSAPKRAGYLFAGWEATGPDGAAYSFDAGATLAGGKLKAAEGDAAAVPISYGERAVEGQEPATTATFTAKWVADLRVDVPIAVDLDLTVDWEQGRVVASGPDGSEHATGEFRSWSSGEVQVAAFGQEAATAAGHRASALGLFGSGDEAKADNLMKVSLVLSADADGAEVVRAPIPYLYASGEQWAVDGMAKPVGIEDLNLVIPPASSAASPGTLKVRYGIDCADDLPLQDVAIDDRPRPILRLVYKVGLANP